MSDSSLAERIREAFLAALRQTSADLVPSSLVVEGILVAELPAAVRTGNNPQRRRDRLWAAALLKYRRGPAGFWAPVILEMLGPALLQTLADLYTMPPMVTDEDLTQQLLAEALETAATIPIPERPWLMERRLILRINNRTVRWLEAQRRARTPRRVTDEVLLDQIAYEQW